MNLANSFSRYPIAVLYLARKAEGLHTFREFLRSYATHLAGISHDLVVIFKGFTEGMDLELARAEFAPFPHISFEVLDVGFDLGSYEEVAKRLEHEYICCLNTFSRITSDNWLKKLYDQIILSDVGIVGATGSYESIHASIVVMQKVIWLRSQSIRNKKFCEELEKYFGFILQDTIEQGARNNLLQLIKQKRAFVGSVYKSARRCLSRILTRQQQGRDREHQYAKWWSAVRQKEGIAKLCVFPDFPNPHIRSNAFMVKRERFLAFRKPLFQSKLDAAHFEHGHESMTRQVLRAGFKARVVDASGAGYDVDQWPLSDTFRLRNQNQLLITDNQTAFFAAANNERRLVYTWFSWGEESLFYTGNFF